MKTTIYAIYGIEKKEGEPDAEFAYEATVSPYVRTSRDIEKWEATLNTLRPGIIHKIRIWYPIKSSTFWDKIKMIITPLKNKKNDTTK